MIAKTELETNRLEELATSISNAALNVRSKMGVGLMDDFCRLFFLQELKNMGLKAKTQVLMPVKYKDIVFEEGYRIDILVEDSVIVLIKPTCGKADLYKAHVSTYLRHSGYPLGFLIDYDAKSTKGCVNRITL
jgi:GxxExxY protein